MHRSASRPQGSILLVALIAMGILALIATTALYQVGHRHAVSHHSQSWNEALTSAEVGADIALAALNASIANPSTAWTAWSPSDASTFPKTWTPPLTPHTGEGNTKVYAQVTVDDSVVDADGQKWFRIRSTGIAEVAGTARAGIEPAVLDASGEKNHRSVLRKARFSNDATGGALHLPQIARSVEVMAGSMNARMLIRALAVRSAITLSGNAHIDSFDSTDSNKSTAGRYDVAKRQDRAHVASNADGGLSDFSNLEVRGNAYCNGGAIENTSGVVGSIFDNFSTAIPPVTTPVWGVINVAPNSIVDPPGGMTLTGGPSGSAQNYKVSAVSLTSSSNPLILAPHAAGQTSYVNIWVTGSIDITGSGVIQQQPGVHVSIYCEGNIRLSGCGIINANARARFLKIFGVDSPIGARTFDIESVNDFIGVINAPDFDLTTSGAASFSGAVIARAAAIGNDGGFHYDEDLGDLKIGPPERFEFASWIEDVR